MKKFISIILLFTLIVGTLFNVRSFAASVPSDWAWEEILEAMNLELVTDNVTVDYHRDITREEFCELVVKLYEKLTDTTAHQGYDVFDDTDNREVSKAYALGIVNGVSYDTFAPHASITRQEICVMLTRCIEAAIPGADVNEYNNNYFRDSSDIADWALAHVNYAYDNNIIKGVGDREIDPLGNVTCEQAILLVYRVYPARMNLTSDRGYLNKQYIREVEEDGFEVDCWDGNGYVYKDYDNTFFSDYSYCLEATEPSDVRLEKTFIVEPDKSYVISALFKTEDVVGVEDEELGANISCGDWNTSAVTLFGDNEWTDLSLVVRSGSRTEITASFNLGYWGNLCTGKVYIDGISCSEAKYDIEDTNVTNISNWGSVSPLQQFKYMDEGLAYAFLNDDMLEIVTPEKELSIDAKYPILGDVISDEDGNFYVVWGKDNTNDNYDTETVFISKYSEDGKHVKTTGFVGESVMGEDGNTCEPFRHGNCSSAIGDGKLMVNYGRGMYNGHQSNNVVGVYIKNMEPVDFGSAWNIPYTSHSFNQGVIWSEYINDFVYADHGDAYDRGFIISAKGEGKNIFHFYLQANADYDMYIVNKTFAQFGGLVETSEGVVLVGASAKSISEDAKSESQNLFVQIFDPTEDVSSSMFVGGEKRRGAMSFDINDNQNSPLEAVTDYGVQWLTEYEGLDVIAPHAVVADDKIVILWNEKIGAQTEAYYMVLSSDGTPLQLPTSLGVNMHLNPNEKPIYHNGEIMWVGACSSRIFTYGIGL